MIDNNDDQDEVDGTNKSVSPSLLLSSSSSLAGLTPTTISDAATNVTCAGKISKECDTIKKREDLTSLGSDDSGKQKNI